MYNELFLIIKTCIEFWKGFFASDNKANYLQKKDSLGYILMLLFSILIVGLILYLVIKLFSGVPENGNTVPVITEKTQTIPVDGKNITCNVKVELYIPKN